MRFYAAIDAVLACDTRAELKALVELIDERTRDGSKHPVKFNEHEWPVFGFCVTAQLEHIDSRTIH